MLRQTEILHRNVIGPRLTPFDIFPLQEGRALTTLRNFHIF